MKSNVFWALSVMITLFFAACEKNSTADNLIDSSTVAESIELEASIDEIESVIDENVFYGLRFFDIGGLFGKSLSNDDKFFTDCANVETTTTDETITIAITFEEGCEDTEGNIISGTISIVFSKTDLSKSRIVTFDAFTMNGYVVNGTKSVAYVAENTNGNPEMSGTTDITVETDEGTIVKTGNRVIEVTAGSDTDTHKDDELTITGSHTYQKANGDSFAVEITTALVKPADCKYIAEGVKQYTKNNEVSTLDYGDGTCDNLATLTQADGTEKEIELRRKRKNRIK